MNIKRIIILLIIASLLVSCKKSPSPGQVSDLGDFLQLELSLLKENKTSIQTKYGIPLEEDWYDGYYLKYDDFIVFIRDHLPDEPVARVWTMDLLGLENNEETIIDNFGEPDEKYIDEMYNESNMVYMLGDIEVTFIGVGEEVPYIEVFLPEEP